MAEVKKEIKKEEAPKAVKPVKRGDKNRLQVKYEKDVIPAMMKKHGFSNVNAVPRVDKVVVNVSFGDIKDNTKSIQGVLEEIALITGQKPLVVRAKKSISNFKLREGQIVGAKVTIRGPRMYDFLERLMNSALPRIRDFRGVPNRGFDGRGNYTLGIKEESIFPEVERGHVHVDHGMDITIVTTAATNDQARELLAQLGVPFAGNK